MPIPTRPRSFDRVRCAGLILGPITFISAWLAAGAMTKGYSPIRDHISDLDAVAAPTRPLMNVAFTTFALAVGLAAAPLRSRLGAPTAAAMSANALLSIGIMVAPLGKSRASDRVHGVVAGLGYLALAATAPSAAPTLAARQRTLARASIAVGVTSMACLVASLVRPEKGFWQRAGITTTDAWMVLVGVLVLADHPAVMTRTLPRD